MCRTVAAMMGVFMASHPGCRKVLISGGLKHKRKRWQLAKPVKILLVNPFPIVTHTHA